MESSVSGDAVITKAAGIGEVHAVFFIAFSYSSMSQPSIGRLTIKVGLVTLFDIDIRNQNFGFIYKQINGNNDNEELEIKLYGIGGSKAKLTCETN